MALAFATVALILYWGRYTLFFHDEWGFALRRFAWNLDSFMTPHNEHWVLGPALIWKVLLEVVGMSAHWPYLLVVAVAHALVAAAVFSYFERETGSVTALAASIVVLLLGSGGENLFWAFQIGFVGATAAGLWAIVIFIAPSSRGRSIAVAGLLTLAIAMSGPGLFFLAAIAAVVVIVPRQRRRFWVLLPPTIVYTTWALTYGRSGTESSLSFSLDQVDQLVAYIRTGIEAAVGSVMGVGPEIGLVLAVILIGATVWSLVSGGPVPEGALAGAAALCVQFAMIGLSRVQFGVEQAGASRYVYTGAVLVLMMIGAWYGARRRSHRPTVGFAVALAALLALSVIVNLNALRDWRDWFWRRGDEARAAIAILAEYGGTPGLPGDRSGHDLTDAVLRGLPSAENVRFMQEELALDVDDLPGNSRPLTNPVYDKVLFRLVEGSIVESATQVMPDLVVPIETEYHADVVLARGDPCLILEPIGPDPRVRFDAAGGANLYLDLPGDQPAQVFISSRGGPVEAASLMIEPAAEGIAVLGLPDLETDTPWRIRVDPPLGGTTSVCLSDGPTSP